MFDFWKKNNSLLTEKEKAVLWITAKLSEWSNQTDRMEILDGVCKRAFTNPHHVHADPRKKVK